MAWYDFEVPVDGGPYLTGAFFCERILREHDGVLSFIRVVDRWNIVGSSEAMPASVIQTNIVILMKSGIHRGASQIIVTPSTPNGIQLATLRLSAQFEGDDDRGIAVAAAMAFPVQESGVYWFDVTVDGQFFTKVPLRIVYQFVAGFQIPNPGIPPGLQQP